MNCSRCDSNGRPNVPATTHQEYRFGDDPTNWPNNETDRCDGCAQALRDYANLPRIALNIVIDRPRDIREDS